MTARDDLAALARRWVSLWTVPVDWALFERIHDEGFVDGSSAGRPSDKRGFAAGLAAFTRSFPDLQTRVEDLVIDEPGSRVSVRWSATGTNREAYMGIGPTHRTTRITGIEIIEVRDERIVRRWGEWDVSDHHEADR